MSKAFQSLPQPPSHACARPYSGRIRGPCILKSAMGHQAQTGSGLEGWPVPVLETLPDAMQESNGTVLSTNWKDVGKAPVNCSPPSGMQTRNWEQ